MDCHFLAEGKKDGNPAHAIAIFDASQASRSDAFTNNLCITATAQHPDEDLIHDFACSEMRLAIEYLEQELTSVRTGRASPGCSKICFDAVPWKQSDKSCGVQDYWTLYRFRYMGKGCP